MTNSTNRRILDFCIVVACALTLWLAVKAHIQIKCVDRENIMSFLKHPAAMALAAFYLLWSAVPLRYLCKAYKESQSNCASGGHSRIIIYFVGIAIIYASIAISVLHCNIPFGLIALLTTFVVLITHITDKRFSTSGRIIQVFILIGFILLLLVPNIT